MKRKNAVEGRFYPGNARACEEELSRYTDFDSSGLNLDTPLLGGIVPHAGWVFSGPTAGKVFAAIRDSGRAETFILFGAVHRFGADRPVIMSEGEWATPLGGVEIDRETAARLRDAAGLDESASAHDGEHSIEVQIPFIRQAFPGAKIVPVLAPPDESSIAAGAAAGEIVRDGGGRVVVVGSTDLTHYGREYGFAPQGTGEKALEWVREKNDAGMVEKMVGLKVEEALGEARRNHNACGAGAIAAVLAAMRAAGKTAGTLLEYTTSHDVMPERGATLFVGYAGVVF